jgi:hypothetical protein
VRRYFRGWVVAAGLAAVIAAAFAPPGLSKKPSTPFYLIAPESTTKECDNVGGCQPLAGPWVVVPAGGVGTYLLHCATKRGWLIGGTDARASSTDVRVWFDGQLGAPIGQPSTESSTGAGLLFHADTRDGRTGSYQPILGCVKLRQKGIRSTVSARVTATLPGSAPAAPLDLHAVNLELSPPVTVVQHVACLPGEKIVSTWESIAFFQGPPDVSHIAKLVKMIPATSGRVLSVTIKTGPPRSFPLGAYPEVQIGVACQT